jgi:hypothetical protein
MIIKFNSDLPVGLNENGTPCLLCPECLHWQIASRFSWHMKTEHPESYKAMLSQARKEAKKRSLQKPLK